MKKLLLLMTLILVSCGGGYGEDTYVAPQTPKNSGKIYFKNPYNDMLSPAYTEYTPDNFERINFKPQPGMLLIFRSHLEHYVDKNNSDEDRISFAYNYRPII